MLILVLLIMICALIGTVFLIGICTPLSAAIVPTALPRNDMPTTVIEESFRDDWNINDDCGGIVSGGNNNEDAIKSTFRKGVASSSVPILRSRGMTDEEIKTELLRDFSLTEEQVDEIMKTQ